MPADHVELLQEFAPFKALDESLRREAAAALQERIYPRGGYVFRQGEESQGFLFLIVDGLAEVTVSAGEQENVVGYRRRRDFFGETVILSGKSYPASVRAVEDLRCLLLPRENFRQLLDRSPAFAAFFSQLVADRLRDLFQQVVREQGFEAYNGEGHAVRRRASELMSTPVLTCRPEDSLATVAQAMTVNQVSSAVVCNQAAEPLGLITEKDLVAKVIARQRYPQGLQARDVMNENVVTVPLDAYYYQVMLAMVRNQVKHVLVMDEGTLVGIITIRDLVKSRSTGTITVIEEIEAQDSLQGLVGAGREVDQVLSALVAEKAPWRDLCAVLTEFHDRLTRKVIAICEQQMEALGWGHPPVPFCWLTMGSGGRREQTLRTDQDNALIYSNPPPGQEEQVVAYFTELARRAVEGLEACGFARCKGNVMASNPYWCRSEQSWREIVHRWAYQPEGEHIRMLTIFLDFRPVYGEKSLAENLRQFVFNLFHSYPGLAQFLAQDDLQSRVPLGLWGQVLTERDPQHRHQINLKRSATRHVVDCLRIFAYRHQVAATFTLDRLDALTAARVFQPEEAEILATSYESLMLFAVRENLKKALQGQEADHYVSLMALSRPEKIILKEALRVVDRLQAFTSKTFLPIPL